MTRSTAPWIHSGMEARGGALEERVCSALAWLVQDRTVHARFLNMLSMLEHIGSRKIMLSQMNGPLSEETLQHLAEEARHAYFFKRQAERAACHPLPGYNAANVMAYSAARMYFGRLDAGIAARVTPEAAYSWVSLIIELRACWLYALYHDALQKADPPLSLKGLLAEEERHLEDMYELCGRDEIRLREFSAMETILFARLWSRIERHAPVLQAA